MNIGNYIKYDEMSIKIRKLNGGHVPTQHNMSPPLFIGLFFSILTGPDRAGPFRQSVAFAIIGSCAHDYVHLSLLN